VLTRMHWNSPMIRSLALGLVAAGTLAAQTSSGFSITTSSLPAGVVGKAYSQTVVAAGGTAPYTFGLVTGSTLPAGLTINTAGLISGTPTTAGSTTFTVGVVDSNQKVASATFTLVINPAPLVITTLTTFSGTVGQAYSQTFTASGGTPPYTWKIASGSVGALTLNGSTGVLSGTPQAAGVLSFTIQVTDSAGATAQQAFSITVALPQLTLTVVSSLPSGTVGIAYSQKLPVTATGGATPYTWSLTSTAVPGLTFDANAVALNGTPTTAGTYTVTVKVTDSAATTATKSLTLTIAPAALTITTPSQLPNGALNATYSQTFTATGGVPPYTWSATGLPGGLTLNSSTGVASGTFTAAGTFSVVVTVTDSTLATAKSLFTINISFPQVPAVTFSGLPSTATPAQQYTLQVSLANAYPVDISGQAILTFSPASGPSDNTVQFAAGGTTASFTIPAGSTTPVGGAPLALQTGTVAGTLAISLRFQAGGVDITPTPAPSITAQIAKAAPVITKLQSSVSGSTLNVVVTGYSTARQVTQAVFTFSAATGQTLQAAASTITVDVSTLFGNWLVDPANSQYGSQFIFTQPFTVTGDASAVIPVSVTLTNGVGSVTKNF